jgi:hypothetical protein
MLCPLPLISCPRNTGCKALCIYGQIWDLYISEHTLWDMPLFMWIMLRLSSPPPTSCRYSQKRPLSPARYMEQDTYVYAITTVVNVRTYIMTGSTGNTAAAFHVPFVDHLTMLYQEERIKNTPGLSPPANYTDRRLSAKLYNKIVRSYD